MGRGPGVEPADTRNDVVSKNICYPDAAAARISTLTLSFWGYAAMTAQPVTYMFERVDQPERRDGGFVPFLSAHEFVPFSLPTHQLLTQTYTYIPTAERGCVRDHTYPRNATTCHDTLSHRQQRLTWVRGDRTCVQVLLNRSVYAAPASSHISRTASRSSPI